jgi:hypothetical protein
VRGDRYPNTGAAAASGDARADRKCGRRLTPRRRDHRLERQSRGGGRIGVVKLLRARGGCLGVISYSGVEGCEMSGGAAERASIPEFPSRPGELKHLSTRRKGNQPRLPQ